MPDTSSEYEKAKAINDAYRTAAMNRKYYSCRLNRAKRLNLSIEIFMAFGTSGAVAAWNIWSNGKGVLVWKILAAIVTLIALIKPFLQLSKTIERYAELVTGYAGLYYDLEQLSLDMKTSKCVGDSCWKRYLSTLQKTKDLGIKDDISVRKRLHRKCFDDVKKEIPASSLWWPEKEIR